MNLTELADEIRARAAGVPRYLVGIAGAPGSGKSTLAAELATALGAAAAVLPMDGFHLDNAVLMARGLFERKGAPETFDVDGFADLLARVRAGGAHAVPTFDRAADRVVPAGDAVSESVRIIVVEGNYLLLDAPGWSRVRDLLDLAILLDEPEEALEHRLVARWLEHGLSPEAAAERARRNDLANAHVVREMSRRPDVIVSTGDATPGQAGQPTITWSATGHAQTAGPGP